jgi:hypothetical protein
MVERGAPPRDTKKTAGFALAPHLLVPGGVFMLTRRFHVLAGLTLSAVWVALVVGATACDLNPQPLPPGEQSGFANDAGASSSSGGGSMAADAGVTSPPLGAGDAAAATPSGSDAAVPEGGAQSLDGATDAPEDAAVDGEAGAPMDGGFAADADADTDASEDGG